MRDTTAPARAGRLEWVGLAVLALPSPLTSIDIFVLLLALPRLSADLHPSGTELLWITDIYGFMLSGFLVTMGTLGDRIGRRRLLLIGAAGFGAASVAAAFSTSPAMLIAARAVLGIAGATLAPCTLALISGMFTVPRERALAIGVWLMARMGGAAIGPVVGGVLLSRFWWGSVFLLGVPAMALLLVAGPLLVPEQRSARAGRVDLVSVAESLATILPVVYGVKELARGGVQPVPVAAIVCGVVAGVVFVRRQRSLAEPLLDLRLFANREFGVVLVGMMLSTMLGGGVMVAITQHLQLVEGLSPLAASLWMLPAVAASITGFQVSPLAARSVRPAVLIGAGLTVTIIGLLVITRVSAAVGSPVTLVTGFALLNLGVGPLVTLGTNLVVGAAPPERAGSAAAISQTSNEFGFALGVALLGSLGAVVYRAAAAASLPGGSPTAAYDSMAGAAAAAAVHPALLAPARAAFTSGLHLVAALSAVLLVGVVAGMAWQLRHVRPLGSAADEPELGAERAA